MSLHNSVRAHISRVEPRVCPYATRSPCHGIRVSLLELLTIPDNAWEGEVVGGNETFLILGYRETDPDNFSLGETLESWVPLLREIHSMVSVSTFQCNIILTLMGSIDLVDQLEYYCEGDVPSYAWSKGMGFETSPIKTRSTWKRPSLTVNTHVSLSPTATDSRVLRGMKALARARSWSFYP